MSDAPDDVVEVACGCPRCKRGRLGSEAADELHAAVEKHPGEMHGPHEGYAVILEELDELWDEVKAQKPDKAKMRKECLQVAAMALRFIQDVCDQ